MHNVCQKYAMLSSHARWYSFYCIGAWQFGSFLDEDRELLEKPEIPFIYSDEVLTGIEYKMASHLICEGCFDEALTVVDTLGARYDGIKRNPWNEMECGNHGPVVDTTGGAFSGGMARGFDFFDAVRYGSVVAGLAVTRHGTALAMPHREQIEAVYQRVVKTPVSRLERN